MNKLKLRNFFSQDADDINDFNGLYSLCYLYNADFKSENIVCAEIDGHVVASGHLEPTDSCEYLDKEGKDANYVHRFLIDTDSTDYDDVEVQIFDKLIDRAYEIKQSYPTKRIQISHVVSHNNLEWIDFLISKGFSQGFNYFIMKRDLTLPLPDYSLSQSIELKRWGMETEEEQRHYLQAEKDSFDGESWSLARLNWFKAGTQWDTITAFYDGKPISSCMTWGISDERSATEQIFTHPEWRKQGVARATLIETLKFLRDEKHKTEATLGVVASNLAALNLYQSLGYKMIDIHVVMVKDIE